MKKRIYKVCLVFLVFFTGIIISGEKVIDYDADEIIMLDNGNMVILKNNVVFKSNDFYITSSNAEIDTELKLFKALNDVILKRGNNTINGDSMYFYYEEEKGIVFGGDSHIDKGYFYGEKIISVNDNLLKIRNGHFTTCDSVRNP
ncbi:LPS export ABC transporter periplasmic protein LptC, partial [candidate division WOR-3 bacterium]|nr:LPS export ABC transporter periplasmic protein LptC [candidate division WOR-3 bacterium]